MKQLIYTLCLGLMMSGCTTANEINLDGKIYVKGSSPHTYIVIEDSNTHKNYQIVNANEFDLKHKQKQHLNITAKIVKESKSPLVPTKIEVLEVE